jgi:hypothetical protein
MPSVDTDALAAQLRTKWQSESESSSPKASEPEDFQELKESFRPFVKRERAQKAEIARRNAEVLAAALPKVNPWTPCQHWTGGSFLCTTCLKQVPPGVLARVQQMYQNRVGEGGYRPFVLSCLDKELQGYGEGRGYHAFSDLENEAWARVTKNIIDFKERPELTDGGIFAWLATIVHHTVTDHFRDGYREKRDVRLTVADGRVHDVAAPDSSIPSKATAVPVKPENDTKDAKRYLGSLGLLK